MSEQPAETTGDVPGTTLTQDLIDSLFKGWESARASAQQEARKVQVRTYAEASTNLIALIESVIRDDPRPQMEHFAHDYLRTMAHFIQAVNASGEVVV